MIQCRDSCFVLNCSEEDCVLRNKIDFAQSVDDQQGLISDHLKKPHLSHLDGWMSRSEMQEGENIVAA